jgi:hypothetical protein
MLALLPAADRMWIARGLHRQLNAAPSAAEERVAELGLLARMIEEMPEPATEWPYVERQAYDEHREHEDPGAARSALLTERYGTWSQACRAAHGLQPDGRKSQPGQPWPTGGKVAKFSDGECIASIRACADALGRVPSSHEYQRWRLWRMRTARKTGKRVRLAPYNAILRELAPERTRRGGWRIVVEIVFSSPSD